MRYNNVIPEEMVLIPNNVLTKAIEFAFTQEELSPKDLGNFMNQIVDSLFNEDCNSQSIYRNVTGTSMNLNVKAFNYNGCYYYWWDLLDASDEWVASGLEFYPFIDDNTSYVLFATRTGQAPFICRENIRFH